MTDIAQDVDRARLSGGPDGVDFFCPFCRRECGWDSKRKTYDAIEVDSEVPRWRQYAHRRCYDERAQQQRSS